MRYVLIGNKRLMKDFTYIFDWLEIIDSIGDIYEYVTKKAKFGVHSIIFCYVDRSESEEKARLLSLSLGRDCFDVMYFIEGINATLNGGGVKPLYIWGCGKISLQFTEKNPDLTITAYIDSNAEIKEFNGKRVLSPVDFMENFKGFIIIANSYYDEIKKNLTGMGFREIEDFISYEEYFDYESAIKKVLFSKPTADIECNEVFEFCQIGGGGWSKLCCLGLQEYSGTVRTKSFQHVWNSLRSKIIRLSIINKTFVFCDAAPCPYIKSKGNGYEYDELFDENLYCKNVKDVPARLNVSIDHTCNLRCAHCRNEILIAKDSEKKQMLNMYENIEDVLQEVDCLIMAGNGEVFFSDIYRKMWKYNINEQNKRHKTINILSNGILFNEKIFDELKERYENIGFGISVDATSKETYSIIRRGNFDVLKHSLELLGKLRREGEIQYFHINFVIRKENVGEMHDFILLGKEIGADRVYFSKLENWVYSEEEFDSISVFDNGSNIKPEYQRYFQDSLLSDPIVHSVNIFKSMKMA